MFKHKVKKKNNNKPKKPFNHSNQRYKATKLIQEGLMHYIAFFNSGVGSIK